MKAIIFLAAVGVFAVATAFPSRTSYKFPQIVGGKDAEIGEIPFQVELTRNGEHWCGGSILDAIHIVTAAHCLKHPPPSYKVIAGQLDRIQDDGTEQERTIDQIRIHENFTYWDGTGDLSNDIAIITLSSPLEFNEYISTVQLPDKGHLATGVARASGWGHLYEEGHYPNVLQKVELELVSDETCEAVWGENVKGDIMICAGGNGGAGVCFADGGGPLVAFDDGVYLAGIVSWGSDVGCALKGYYDGFTEVSAFVDWIATAIQE